MYDHSTDTESVVLSFSCLSPINVTICTLKAVGFYKMLVTVFSSKKLSGTFVERTALRFEGKTEAFHTFDCIFKSLQITETSVSLIFYKGDIN